MKIVLIGCTKKKLTTTEKVQAQDLYSASPLFKKGLVYAKSLKPDRIYIISAEHGLVELDEMLKTYNKTLNNSKVKERKDWADKVLTSLKNKGVDPEKAEIIILAGKNYWEYLASQMSNVHLPYEGKRIGKILQYLNEILKQNLK